MASPCPTSSATYLCKERERESASGSPGQAHPAGTFCHISRKARIKGLMVFWPTPCDCLKFMPHTLSLTFCTQETEQNITSFSEDQACICMGFFFLLLFSSFGLANLEHRGLAFTFTKGSNM